MKRYEKYKDSGIEWIGEIPEHWDISKIKYHFSLLNGYPFDSSDISPFKTEYPIIRIGNVTNGHIDVYFSGEINNQHPIIENGDYILSLTGDFNIRKWENGKALLNQRCVKIYSLDENNERVLFYIIPFYFKILEKTKYFTTLKNLANNEILDLKILLPPSSEQTAIANYLDRKTAEIDELITDKKRLLELYEEEKTAIINQAVTKGLDPDVPMKDSGIEWLGEIPEHWEVKRLKYVVSINDEVLTEKTDEEYEIEYVEISGVKSGMGIVETFNYRFKDAPSRARRIVREGDILVSTVRTYLKSIAKVDTPPHNLIASTGFAVIRPRLLNSDYLGFLFYSEPLIGEIISLSTGVSYPAINSSQIGNIIIPIPNKAEQQSIAQHIKTECARIDAKKTNAEKLIELLTEYRTALISEVVTGKIKVTD